MQTDFELSPHFTFYELTKTDHAELQDQNRTSALAYVSQLVRLCGLLEQCRSHLGALHVTSGFRDKELNEAVGGSATSQHMHGLAADVVPASGLSIEACAKKLMDAHVPYQQLLIEPGCLHISSSIYGQPPRREAARWENGNKTALA